MASSRGAVQWCPAVLVFGVDLGALAQQHLDHLVLAVRRRDVQASLAVAIGAVQKLRRAAEQKPDYGCVPAEAGQVQRVVAILRCCRVDLQVEVAFEFRKKTSKN